MSAPTKPEVQATAGPPQQQQQQQLLQHAPPQWAATTPLERAVEDYHRRQPMKLRRQLLFRLRAMLKELGTVVMSSACSGCDIAFICCSKLFSYWKATLDVAVDLKHGFVCEKDPSKQKFLQDQHEAALFEDVMDLVKARAVDKKSGQVVWIPSCTIFTAGFSCKSRSSLNNKRSNFKSCLQLGMSEAETSQTWEYTFGYIKEQRPPIAILENVTNLMEKDSAKGEKSDAEFIETELQKAGYYVHMLRFDAETFGSRASRVRLYFLAWEVGVDLTVHNELLQALHKSLQWLWEVHQACSTGPMPASDFMALQEDKCEDCDDAWLEERGGSKQQTDAKWRTEHCQAFRDAGLEWPVPLESNMELPADEGGRPTRFQKLWLGTRAAELAFYLHKVYPMAVDASEPEWADVNPSLPRCTHSGSPWKSTCPTMTGQSQMVVRYVLGSRVILRPQSGKESFSLMGWHASYFRGQTSPPDQLLKNLAGNAFSAFAITPVLLLAVAGLHVIREAKPEVHTAPDAIEGAGGAMSDGELSLISSD